MNISERLRRKINIQGEDDCWEWKGNKFLSGYGVIKWRRKQWRTHRLAWTLVYGEIPKGLLVCHHCDNKICCNPKHLFLGTHQDNMTDGVKKGRFRRGSDHPQSKLTEKQVLDIYKLRQQGNSGYKIASYYNVSAVLIYLILRGKSWKHLYHHFLREDSV